MAENFNKRTASKMYARMKDEGCSTKFIQEMILIAFPKADLEEVILCMAENINNPPAKSKDIVLMSPDEVRQRRKTPPGNSTPNHSNDTGCLSSSRLTNC